MTPISSAGRVAGAAAHPDGTHDASIAWKTACLGALCCAAGLNTLGTAAWAFPALAAIITFVRRRGNNGPKPAGLSALYTGVASALLVVPAVAVVITVIWMSYDLFPS